MSRRGDSRQLAFAFEVVARTATVRKRKRRIGLRLAPRRERDIKPANLPRGYQPAYEARLAAAQALPSGPRRIAALAQLHDPAPFDAAADRAEEALALSWLWRDHAARADQAAE